MRAPRGEAAASLRLEVRWSGGWGQFGESLAALCAPQPRLPAGPAAFSLLRIGRRWLIRGLLASAGLHLLVATLPLPEFLTRAPAPPPAFSRIRIEYDLKWAAHSKVLPPLAPTARLKPTRPRTPKAPRPAARPELSPPQVIASLPAEPNHPRQTLLTESGLESARLRADDIRLPNLVIPPAPRAAPLPTVDLSELRLAPALSVLPGAPPASRLKKASEVSLAQGRVENLYPKLAVLPAAPALEESASPADGSDSSLPGILALSAQPGSPAPVLELPEANLRARFSTGASPGSSQPAELPAAIPELEESPSPAEVNFAAAEMFVAYAGPVPPGPAVVGPPEPPAESAPAGLAPGTGEETPRRPGESPEARAEQLLGGLRPGSGLARTSVPHVYTVLINMPNLTSSTGSWVLRFSEVGEASSSAPGGAANGFALEAPVPVKKVDPPYPGPARQARLEGSVVLYGVIRADGRVESVRVVRSVHELLDQSAVAAFQRWRFQPGRKNGAPVDLEVVVEIPFRLTRLF